MDREEQKMGQGGLKILFGPKKLFFVVKLALEPVGLFGACQQCYLPIGNLATRVNCVAKGRMAAPNRINFGKIPNGLRPHPPHFP